ncbi:hypothetical protein TWF481_008496 [Arthrobotrys musiformis]|uniref:B box-type domain-containing protein n=1 Tax=Arthrobotrys musiformis TaxID=47236 RepID=A0AAV9W7B6_9PEZI
MKPQQHEEEDLLLDLYDYPGEGEEEQKQQQQQQEEEELLLLDFDEIVVQPGANNQPPEEPTPKPPIPSADTSKVGSSSTSIPVETDFATETSLTEPDFWDLHPHLKGLAEREDRYRTLNQKDVGGPGELTPKFVTDLIRYREGTICLHAGAFIKREENWLKCAKCKAQKPDLVFECKACNTLLCLRCKFEVQGRGAWRAGGYMRG